MDLNDQLIWLLGAVVFFCLSFREAWFEAMMKRHVQEDRLYVLAFAFFVSVLLAAFPALMKVGAGKEHVDFSKASTVVDAVLLVITTAVGLPTAFIAILSALGSARASFIDYASVPLFSIFVSLVYRDLGEQARPLAALGLVVCVAGCVAIVASLRQPTEGVGVWPPGLSRSSSILLGLGCAVASGFCGAWSLQLARRLVTHVDQSLILTMRLIPIPLLLLYVSRLRGNRQWRLGKVTLAIAALCGSLVFIQLYLLYQVLTRQTLDNLSGFMFLIPLLIFLFNLVPFRLRRPAEVPALEWAGMVLILGGFVGWSVFGK
jgi:hypothetical protein